MGRRLLPATKRRELDESTEQIFAMKRRGIPTREIARQLNLPPGTVSNRVTRALKLLARARENAADRWRTLELSRLEAVLAALWDRAVAGDLPAIDRLVRVIELQARLAGAFAQPSTQAAGKAVAVQINIHKPEETRLIDGQATEAPRQLETDPGLAPATEATAIPAIDGPADFV